jgi:hypothetical protein
MIVLIVIIHLAIQENTRIDPNEDPIDQQLVTENFLGQNWDDLNQTN